MTGRKRDIDDLAGEIQELFADMWQVPRFSGHRPGYRPQADCFRTDDPPALNVVVELPGVDPAAVEVVVAGRALTVSGERTRPRVEGAHYLAIEIEYGSFHRRIDLGVDIDPANVTATYDKGVLTVHLPLAPQRHPEKVDIEIRSK